MGKAQYGGVITWSTRLRCSARCDISCCPHRENNYTQHIWTRSQGEILAREWIERNRVIFSDILTPAHTPGNSKTYTNLPLYLMFSYISHNKSYTQPIECVLWTIQQHWTEQTQRERQKERHEDRSVRREHVPIFKSQISFPRAWSLSNSVPCSIDLNQFARVCRFPFRTNRERK